MSTVVGFTGTRRMMTSEQRRAITRLLAGLFPFAEAHHGDCVGADATFHKIIDDQFGVTTVAHPPDNAVLWARMPADVVLAPKPYLDRDRDIVDASTVMIACPYQREEQQRSGTWATIRMARKAGKPLAIVYPDGDVSRERWPEPVDPTQRRSS